MRKTSVNGAQNRPETLTERNLRVTGSVMEAMAGIDTKDRIVICCNIVGHLISTISNGNLTMMMAHCNSISESMRKAAIDKIMHDEEQLKLEKEKK